jgi:hypothetical protein
VSQLDVLINRFLDDRSELSPDELDELIAGLRAEPARAATLREQLIVDDLVAQKLTVDRRNFLAQVEQRIADFERSEDEIDSQVAELHELAASQYERPSSWSGNSTWVKAALALSLAAIVAGFFLLPRWLPGDRRAVAKVVAVQGGVTATEQQNPSALAASTTLFSGQLIDAPADGSLTMEYDDKTQVRIGGGSRVTLKVETGSGAKRIHIERGDVWADVAKQTAGPMQFVTPHAVATVLGTQLRLTVTRNDTLLEVTEGLVRLDRVAERDFIEVATNQSGLASEETIRLRPVAWPSSTEGLAYAFDPLVRRVPRTRNPTTGNWYSSPLEVVGSAAVNEFTDALELTGGYFHSLDDGRDIVTVSQPSSEFTLELVYVAAASAATNRARIVGIEGADRGSNFSLETDEDEFAFRLLTDSPDEAIPFKFKLASPPAPAEPRYLTITYRDGQLAAYLDASLVASGDSIRGTLATWTPGPLMIGAASHGKSPWHGTIEALAVYHRCLDAEEVAQNVRNYQLLTAGQP